MSCRPFELPADIPALIELIPPSFQYPENEAWSLQADEVESFVDTLNGIRRIWPLIRLLQLLVPPLRDLLLGYVWEEDGKPVGLTNILRQGATNRWYIGDVAVLPDYRRRGIARALVEACMDLARTNGAEAITLDVVAGNVPAYQLYERLGFEHFSGATDLTYTPGDPLTPVPPPEGYRLEARTAFNWRLRYGLAQRITPEAVRRYTPVDERRFKVPAVVRILRPVIRRATGVRTRQYMVWGADGRVVAVARAAARQRTGGVNDFTLDVDPAHTVVVTFLLNTLLRDIAQLSPGRRIDCVIPHWQEGVVQAALDMGFVKRLDRHTMGIILEQP